jgi:hypothetical protein
VEASRAYDAAALSESRVLTNKSEGATKTGETLLCLPRYWPLRAMCAIRDCLTILHVR